MKEDEIEVWRNCGGEDHDRKGEARGVRFATRNTFVSSRTIRPRKKLSLQESEHVSTHSDKDC